jgi:hypothetical protein
MRCIAICDAEALEDVFSWHAKSYYGAMES